MAGKQKAPKPTGYRTLKKRSRIPAKGKVKTAEITVADFALDGLRSPRLIRKQGRLLVSARVDSLGIRRKRRHERIPITCLAKQKIDVANMESLSPGLRPSGLPTLIEPKLAKRTHALRPSRSKDVDRGGTIFGTDNRYLFDDHSFPWRTTGKVRTAGKWGSGVTIGPRLVLTASHVVNWTGGTGGGVAWITFTPSYFDGSGPWGEIAATRVIYWRQNPGSMTDSQTAFDYVVLVMESPIGDVVGYPGYRTYDNSWNGGSYWQYIGYPGELSSGERPAFQGNGVISSVGSHNFSGQKGYVLGHFNDFTPGQSGGIAWGWWDSEPWPRVVGVGSTIGSTAVQKPHGSTNGDNEYGGGPALSALISWARSNYP